MKGTNRVHYALFDAMLKGFFMARISTEEKWWTDPRRSALAKLLGSEALADGALLKLWRISQDFWKQFQRGIPEPIFILMECSKEICSVGLAISDGEFVYVCGSKEHHHWLVERSVSGRAGNAIRWGKTDRKRSQTYRKRSQTIASSSSSSSKDKETTCPSDTTKLFLKFSDAMVRLSGCPVPKSAAAMTMCSKIIGVAKLDRALLALDFFFQDEYSKNAGFPLALFYKNINSYLVKISSKPTYTRITSEEKLNGT